MSTFSIIIQLLRNLHRNRWPHLKSQDTYCFMRSTSSCSLWEITNPSSRHQEHSMQLCCTYIRNRWSEIFCRIQFVPVHLSITWRQAFNWPVPSLLLPIRVRALDPRRYLGRRGEMENLQGSMVHRRVVYLRYSTVLCARMGITQWLYWYVANRLVSWG